MCLGLLLYVSFVMGYGYYGEIERSDLVCGSWCEVVCVESVEGCVCGSVYV